MLNVVNISLMGTEALKHWLKSRALDDSSADEYKTLLRALRALRGTFAMPFSTMKSDYSIFEQYVDTLNQDSVDGDICEIGSFNGVGTRKLAMMCQDTRRRIVCIEAFESQNDETAISEGFLRDLYRQNLGIWNQRFLFSLNTTLVRNKIFLIDKDSKTVQFDPNQKLAFSFIDGNHSPEYVQSDFDLIFSHTSPGGFVAFHDYGKKIPHMIDLIDNIINTQEGIQMEAIYPEALTAIARKEV